jgi:hypothetical protein
MFIATRAIRNAAVLMEQFVLYNLETQMFAMFFPDGYPADKRHVNRYCKYIIKGNSLATDQISDTGRLQRGVHTTDNRVLKTHTLRNSSVQYHRVCDKKSG